MTELERLQQKLNEVLKQLNINKVEEVTTLKGIHETELTHRETLVLMLKGKLDAANDTLAEQKGQIEYLKRVIVSLEGELERKKTKVIKK